MLRESFWQQVDTAIVAAVTPSRGILNDSERLVYEAEKCHSKDFCATQRTVSDKF